MMCATHHMSQLYNSVMYYISHSFKCIFYVLVFLRLYHAAIILFLVHRQKNELNKAAQPYHANHITQSYPIINVGQDSTELRYPNTYTIITIM